MRQYSVDNLSLEIEILSGHLLFIDPLYFQNIIENYQLIDISSVIDGKEIVKIYEEQLFPYGGGGLLGYKYVGKSPNTYLFNPQILESWDDEDEEMELLAQQKQITTFGLDTSQLLIMDIENINKLVSLISYDDLTDAILDNKLDKYFDTTNNKLGNKGWGYCDIERDGPYLVP